MRSKKELVLEEWLGKGMSPVNQGIRNLAGPN